MASYDCDECSDMLTTGLFTAEEVEAYHNADVDMKTFSKQQQEVIRKIYDKYKDEE